MKFSLRNMVSLAVVVVGIVGLASVSHATPSSDANVVLSDNYVGWRHPLYQMRFDLLDSSANYYAGATIRQAAFYKGTSGTIDNNTRIAAYVFNNSNNQWVQGYGACTDLSNTNSP